jgi:hypothetical protein
MLAFAYSVLIRGVVGLLPLGSRLFDKQDIEVPESLLHTSVGLPLALTVCATPTRSEVGSVRRPKVSLPFATEFAVTLNGCCSVQNIR